jgi:hypothetical protein
MDWHMADLAMFGLQRLRTFHLDGTMTINDNWVRVFFWKPSWLFRQYYLEIGLKLFLDSILNCVVYALE